MDQVAAVQAREFYRLAQVFVPGPDTPADQIREVRNALKTAHHRLTPGMAHLTQANALRIIAAAGQQLLDTWRGAEAALLLSRCTDPALSDRSGVALLRCRALIQTRRREAAVAEADRLLGLTPADATRNRAVFDLMQAAYLQHDLHPRLRLHDLFWGPPAATVGQTLAGLDASGYRPAFDDEMLAYLTAIRNVPVADRDTLHLALAWGLAASQYRKFLSGGLMALRDRRRAHPNARHGLSDAYLDSAAHLGDVPPDPALQALVAQGRSVVLVQSHSGARGVISQSLADLDCPLSMVGKGSRVVRCRDGDFNITTGSASDLPLQFLKLAKLARSGLRVIRLLPDGKDGSAFGEIDLFGRKVMIGLGAAALALHGKAVLAFAHTRWTGGAWAAEVTIGPDLAKVSDRARAETLFLDFYAENLRNILLGPAQDIGGTGGYLTSLRRGTTA